MFQNSVLSTTPVSPGTLSGSTIPGSTIPGGGISQQMPKTGSSQITQRLAGLVPLPTTARQYLAWTGVMVLIAGLVSIQLWISLSIAQTEQEIAELNREYVTIEQANAEMLWKISQYTSLSYVQREAREAGFVTSLRPSYRFAPAQPATTLTGETVIPVAPQDERVSFLAEPDERIVPIEPLPTSASADSGQMGINWENQRSILSQAWGQTQIAGQEAMGWMQARWDGFQNWVWDMRQSNE